MFKSMIRNKHVWKHIIFRDMLKKVFRSIYLKACLKICLETCLETSFETCLETYSDLDKLHMTNLDIVELDYFLTSMNTPFQFSEYVI